MNNSVRINTNLENKSRENLLFPKHTNYINENAGIFFKNISTHQTAPANLYNKAGMLNLDESVWQEALSEQNGKNDNNSKRYLDFEESKNSRTYKYDSNMDGKYETRVLYGNNGTIWAMIQDEYNSKINSIQISPKINHIHIGFDNGSSYGEFAGNKGTFENNKYKSELEYSNIFIKRNNENRFYKVTYNEDGTAKDIILKKQEK